MHDFSASVILTVICSIRDHTNKLQPAYVRYQNIVPKVSGGYATWEHNILLVHTRVKNRSFIAHKSCMVFHKPEGLWTTLPRVFQSSH